MISKQFSICTVRKTVRGPDFMNRKKQLNRADVIQPIVLCGFEPRLPGSAMSRYAH